MRFILFITIILIFFVNCTSLSNITPHVMQPVSKIFYADYSKTWRATMLALEDYLIEVENNDSGYLQTENIKYNTIWKMPFKLKQSSALKTYTLHIKLIKYKKRSRPIVKVQILKKLFMRKGFIEDKHRIPSSGLEEKKLLYRILRELNIEQAISNNFKLNSE